MHYMVSSLILFCLCIYFHCRYKDLRYGLVDKSKVIGHLTTHMRIDLMSQLKVSLAEQSTRVLSVTIGTERSGNCRFSTDIFWRMVSSHEWVRIILQRRRRVGDEFWTTSVNLSPKSWVGELCSLPPHYCEISVLYHLGSGIFPRPYVSISTSYIYRRHRKWRQQIIHKIIGKLSIHYDV